MDNKYISIKEFAAAAGVTPQYIYKKLNNQLNNQFKGSLIIENGKKLININALSLFKNKPETTDEQPVEQPLNNSLTTSLQATIDILKSQNESLNKQIIEQNNQINSLMELNKNNQILLLNQQNLLSGTVSEPEQKKRASLWDKIFKR